MEAYCEAWDVHEFHRHLQNSFSRAAWLHLRRTDVDAATVELVSKLQSTTGVSPWFPIQNIPPVWVKDRKQSYLLLYDNDAVQSLVALWYRSFDTFYLDPPSSLWINWYNRVSRVSLGNSYMFIYSRWGVLPHDSTVYIYICIYLYTLLQRQEDLGAQVHNQDLSKIHSATWLPSHFPAWTWE